MYVISAAAPIVSSVLHQHKMSITTKNTHSSFHKDKSLNHFTVQNIICKCRGLTSRMQDVVAQNGCSLPLINGLLQTDRVGGAGFLVHMTICMMLLLIWGSLALRCCHARVMLTFK